MVRYYRRSSGTSQVIAQIRAKGEQDVQVQVADPVSGIHTSEVAIRFGRALIYLEDQAALESLTRAVLKARALAPKVFPDAPRPQPRAERR
jgi:hypothetical protein